MVGADKDLGWFWTKMENVEADSEDNFSVSLLCWTRFDV